MQIGRQERIGDRESDRGREKDRGGIEKQKKRG